MSADTPTSLGAERRFPTRTTWIELAIAVAIISGLVAFLVPAVQKARDAAKASQTS